MSSHSSLPKNLPTSKSKTKAKMFTLGSSPKKVTSPTFNNLANIQNACLFSQKSTESRNKNKQKSFRENLFEKYKSKQVNQLESHEIQFLQALKKPYVVKDQQQFNVGQNLFKTNALGRMINEQHKKEEQSFKNYFSNQYDKSETLNLCPLSVKQIKFPKQEIVPQISLQTGKKFNIQESNFMLSNKTNWYQIQIQKENIQRILQR